ncbi:MAG: hypothetical protein CMH49_06320 [Myxococcales bacterium]|nr:hypothetical protein [Myxococcales bacterium]
MSKNREKTADEVIIITQVFHPDTQATSQLLSTLATALSRSQPQNETQSLKITVLASYPSKVRGQAKRAQSLEQWGDVLIKRGGLKIDSKKSLFHRAFSYLSYLLWLLYVLTFKVNKNHRILVVTNPPFAPLIVYIATRLRSLTRSSFAYYVLLHDIYPDGLLALGKIKSEYWWVKLWRSLNRQTFAAAERVITLGRDMSEHCKNVYQLSSDDLTVITNWSPVDFDLAKKCQASQTDLWQQLPANAQNPKVMLVQYSGNMGLWHDIDGIVEAADLVKDLPIHFLMIGDGRRKPSAQAYAQSLDLNNMTWLPFQDLDKLSDSLQCTHLSLVSQRPEVLGIMVPSKYYGILASGRAVLAQAPAQSEIALSIKEHQCGVVLSDPSPQALAAQLRTLYLDREQVDQMGIHAYHAYQKEYSFSQAVNLFRALLNKN